MNWFLTNVPATKSANARFGTIDSWLLWNLSGGVHGGVHATDVTNASRTLFMNLETLNWDEELLNIFGVSPTALPVIKSSSEQYALTNPHGPFGTAIPIAAILGIDRRRWLDRCVSSAVDKTTYGTGNFALLNTGTEIVDLKWFAHNPLLQWHITRYALEGSVAVMARRSMAARSVGNYYTAEK